MNDILKKNPNNEEVNIENMSFEMKKLHKLGYKDIEKNKRVLIAVRNNLKKASEELLFRTKKYDEAKEMSMEEYVNQELQKIPEEQRASVNVVAKDDEKEESNKDDEFSELENLLTFGFLKVHKNMRVLKAVKFNLSKAIDELLLNDANYDSEPEP
mmetsp:Transcript_12353/g.18443  ORF Transcript_12353/g.18443 Transcript_12353/m.18443 type:complete len:156 (+) Transcript_12353:43-510(+)